MGQYLLLKFMKDEYVDDFLNGSLYMNTLHYFWNDYRERQMRDYRLSHPDEDGVPLAALRRSMQEDILEGTIGVGRLEGLGRSFADHILTDDVFRAVGYQYCNVLCFYRLDYESVPFGSIGIVRYDIPPMDEFGDSVVIVDNQKKLLERIRRSAQRKGYRFVCGDVRYWDPSNVDLLKQEITYCWFRTRPLIYLRSLMLIC